jgi:hypothetical protein
MARVERSMISEASETGTPGGLQARKEIAKSMLAQGFSPEHIKKITGFSE